MDRDKGLLKTDALNSISVASSIINVEKSFIETMFKALRKYSLNNNIFSQFDSLKTINDDTCLRVTGLKSEDFDILLENLHSMREREQRTRSQALAVFLFWLKTGIEQEVIASYFGIIDQQQVSRYCSQVRDALL